MPAMPFKFLYNNISSLFHIPTQSPVKTEGVCVVFLLSTVSELLEAVLCDFAEVSGLIIRVTSASVFTQPEV